MAGWQLLIEGTGNRDMQTIQVLDTIAGAKKFEVILRDVTNTNSFKHFDDVEIWAPATSPPGGLILDGTDDYIDLANTLEMDSDDWSISWWMKRGAQKPSNLDGWGYSERITLTGGSSGAQTNYQMKLDVAYCSGMKSDFSDIRFTKSDGITGLDCWCESYVASTSAVIWVKTDTPANAVDADIYMCYGNSGASSDWDGSATFNQYQGSTSTDFKLANSAGSSNTRMRIKYTKGASTNEYIGASSSAAFSDNDSMYFGLNPANIANCVTCDGGICTQRTAVGGGATTNTYELLLVTGTDAKFYRDGVVIKQIATDVPNTSMGLKLQGIGAGGEWVWGFLAKYVTNPATYVFESINYETIFCETKTGASGVIEVDATKNCIRIESSTNAVWEVDMETGIDTSDGEWHHYVLVFAAASTKLYVDNTLADTETANSDSAAFDINYIGHAQEQTTPYGDFLQGSIADVRVFAEDIDTDEITRLHVGKYTTACKAFYTLHQSSAEDDAIYDRVEFSHGTSYTASSTKGALTVDTSPLNQFIAFKGRTETIVPDYDTDTVSIVGRDYIGALLTRAVVESYTTQLRSYIINDILLKYGTAMTRRNIDGSPAGDTLTYLFKTSAWDAVVKCAKEDTYRFWVDVDKDFHYHEKGYKDSGVTIEVGVSDVLDYNINEMGSEVVNRVAIYGEETAGTQVVAMVEDVDSQNYYDGIFDKRIVDLSIKTEADAIVVGEKYLDEHAYVLDIVEMNVLGESALNAGELITLKIPDIGVDGSYIVIDKHLSYPKGITSIKVAKYAKNLEGLISDMVDKILMLEKFFMEESSAVTKIHRVHENVLHTDRLIIDKRASNDSFKIGVENWCTIGETKIGGRGSNWTSVYDSG